MTEDSLIIELDELATSTLTLALGEAIKAHYGGEDPPQEDSPRRVFEVLAALGLVVDMVLEGADYDPRAVAFFCSHLRRFELMQIDPGGAGRP